MAEWLSRAQALAALGIKPQSLYAYVSRGRIAMMADPADTRRSLYLAEDIAALAARRARGRSASRIAASTVAWGEPLITTSISTVTRGILIYRGRDAAAWARTATLEETAALLWESPEPVRFTSFAHPAGTPFGALAGLVSMAPPMLGRGPSGLLRDAQAAAGAILAGHGLNAPEKPAHENLAALWALDAARTEKIRQALALLADHELNASTFAARVAASTGASLAASLLAGLSTLSGPRHGGAGAALIALLDDTGRLGAMQAVAAWLARNHAIPGFGHPLYPDGDPRAAALLEGIEIDPLARALCGAVLEATGALPNVDFALTAMMRLFRLPGSAPLTLFTVARSVGWAAHAMEQIAAGSLIRPRARYIGRNFEDS